MNDGQYISLRNYLEEIASQGKQLLAAQQRTNELLEQLASVETAKKARLIKEVDAATEQIAKAVAKKGK